MVLLDLGPVKSYLDAMLSSTDCEDEVAYSVLNLLATAVLRLDHSSYTEADEIDTAINYLEGVQGFTREHSHEVCKNAEAMIFRIVYEHIPDFGKDHYYGHTATTITNDLAAVTIDTQAWSVQG